MGKIIKRFLTPHPPIIIPEIGQGEEERIPHTVRSMKEIAKEIKDLKPKTILLITPHGPLFKGAISVSDIDHIEGNFGKFGRPEIGLSKKVNINLTKKIIENVLDEEISVAPIDKKSKEKYDIEVELDHGALVPLYFIDSEYSDYDIVHITYGIMSKEELYKVGSIIKDTVEEFDESVTIVASGDLSHRLKDTGPYEYNENGEVFDKEILSLLEKGETLSILNMDEKLIEDAAECGLRSIYILLGTLENCEFRGELLSYEGTFGVGYGVMSFTELSSKESLLGGLEDIDQKDKIEVKKSKDPYVLLAYQSLNYFLENDSYMEPQDLPINMLTEKRGVFVTFKMDGELRGCIGTIFPTTDSTASEIIRNSVEAGTRDPRFYPINIEELPYLEISVDELMQPEEASFEDLDPKYYGVIVRTNRKSGILLPDLEGVETKEQQVNIALRKAGITEDEDYLLERFKVIRHR